MYVLNVCINYVFKYIYTSKLRNLVELIAGDIQIDVIAAIINQRNGGRPNLIWAIIYHSFHLMRKSKMIIPIILLSCKVYTVAPHSISNANL